MKWKIEKSLTFLIVLTIVEAFIFIMGGMSVVILPPSVECSEISTHLMTIVIIIAIGLIVIMTLRHMTYVAIRNDASEAKGG